MSVSLSSCLRRKKLFDRLDVICCIDLLHFFCLLRFATTACVHISKFTNSFALLISCGQLLIGCSLLSVPPFSIRIHPDDWLKHNFLPPKWMWPPFGWFNLASLQPPLLNEEIHKMIKFTRTNGCGVWIE